MTKKQITIFIVAILSVSISLYSALKPSPVNRAEQLVQIEDAKLIQGAEKFALKVRELADRRSLRSLYRITSADGSEVIAFSVKELKSFSRKGWKVDSVCHTEKQTDLYTCKISNDADQRGNMMLFSPNGKKWSFVAFVQERQKAER